MEDEVQFSDRQLDGQSIYDITTDKRPAKGPLVYSHIRHIILRIFFFGQKKRIIFVYRPIKKNNFYLYQNLSLFHCILLLFSNLLLLFCYYIFYLLISFFNFLLIFCNDCFTQTYLINNYCNINI